MPSWQHLICLENKAQTFLYLYLWYCICISASVSVSVSVSVSESESVSMRGCGSLVVASLFFVYMAPTWPRLWGGIFA